MMAALKRDWNRWHGLDNAGALLSTGGTSTAYTITYSNAPASLFTGFIFGFKVHTDCGADPTVNVNTLGAKNIQKPTTAGLVNLVAGDLEANSFALCRFDATLDKAILLTPTAGAGSVVAASETVSGISELATNAETATGTDTARVPPVSALASAVSYQGLQTIWIPAGAMTAATTNGAASGSTELATNKNMLKTLDYDTATQEFAQFDITMPKSWNQGTVTFVPVWTAASGSGTVVFALQAVGTRDDDAMDVAFGTEQTSTDTLITANDCHVGPTSAAITVAGTLTSPLRVNFRVKRNVADDTLGVDAKLIGVYVYYSTNLKNDS